MKTANELHQDMIAYWNGPGGMHWVQEQARVDAMIQPVADALLAHAKVRPGDTVLDVGCGNGFTSIELAKRVGPRGRIIGLDVSAPMVAVARERGKGIANLEFILGDAAAQPFPAPVADLLFSRFGVMFFGDPTAAFANLRKALKPGGRVVFACWRKFDENPWMQVPLRAAYEHVPRLPQQGPDDPGPFSFADKDRVKRILTGAGFQPPRFTPVDLTFDVAGGKGIDAAVHQATTIGATSNALRDQPANLVAAATQAIRAALTPHLKDNRVLLQGAIWLVDAAT